jgi:hypothetical protein
MAGNGKFREHESVFGPEAVQSMSAAFEEVCRSLKLDGDAQAREAVAVRIIELARRGERNAERLRDRVLREANLDDAI